MSVYNVIKFILCIYLTVIRSMWLFTFLCLVLRETTVVMMEYYCGH